eukprot:356634_1
MSLIELRNKNKRLFNEYLIQFMTSLKFNAALQSIYGNKKYRMVQYASCYKHQSLQILSYQFCSIGGTNHAKILQLSIKDHYNILSIELDHLENTGLGIVIVDKYNNVCLISYISDICDMPSFKSLNNISEIYHKKLEICNATLKNDPLYQKYVISKKHKLKYGKIMYADKIAIRPDLLGSGLALLDPSREITQLMGYKYMYYLHTNYKTILWGKWMETSSSLVKNGILWKQSSIFDFSDFTFSDTISIKRYFEQLKCIGFNMNKLQQSNCKVAVLFGFMGNQTPTIQQAIDNCILLITLLYKYKKKGKL